MAFVNLPPNLKDMFYTINDRLAKLETQPNQAMYTAESAQSTAVSAQSVASDAEVQAINAGIAANQAASQATIAQSQATIASTQATVAQTTANGKNKVTYSTSTPGSTANQVGDIWYQYGTSGTYANKVIAQWSGAGGTSWTSVTVSGLVIANIDAGAITTGTLSAITISAGSGSTAFNVSSTGVMSAQGAYIKGNITADSGTFNGTLYSNTGYFGTSPNTWTIGSSGLTGAGTASITGGAISGSTITTNSGTIAGWTLNSTGLTNATSTAAIYTDGTFNSPTKSFLKYISVNNGNNGSGATPSYALAVGGLPASFESGVINSGSLTQQGTMTYSGIATGSGSTMVIVSTGSRVAYTTSSERFKQNIKYISNDGWLDKVVELQPITYKTNEDFTTEGEPNETQVGFLAEDIADLENEISMVVNKDPLGDPFSISYDRLTPFLVLALKELKEQNLQLEQRIVALESNS